VWIWQVESQQKRQIFRYVLPDLTIPKDEEAREDSFNIFSWSADSAYLGFSGVDVQNHRVILYFWSSENRRLSQFPLPPYREDSDDTLVPRRSWSNRGHRLAVAASDGVRKWLGIVTPDIGIEALDLPSDTRLGISYQFYHPSFYWSPDAHYLAIRTFATQDSLRVKTLALGIYEVGQGTFSRLAYTNDDENYGDLDAKLNRTASWSRDGRSFYFWSLQGTGEARSNAIRVFRLETQKFETLVDHIVDYQRIDRAGTRYAIDRLHEGTKHDVQLVNADGSDLVSIVSDADSILSPAPYIKHPPMIDLSDDNQTIVVLWATGEGFTPSAKAHITWMNVDGTNRHQIDTSYIGVTYTRFDGKWLGYVGDQTLQSKEIQLIDTVTGKQYPLLTQVPESAEVRYWSLSVSPDGKQATIDWDTYEGGPGELFLIERDTQAIQRLQADAKVVSSGVWSPDGSQLGYMFSDTTRSSYEKLAVLNLSTFKVKIYDQFGSAALADLKWVACNP